MHDAYRGGNGEEWDPVAKVAHDVAEAVAHRQRAVDDILRHLDSLEQFLKSLDAPLFSEDEALQFVTMLVKDRYGQTVLDLGAGESSATRQRALKRLQDEADGDYY